MTIDEAIAMAGDSLPALADVYAQAKGKKKQADDAAKSASADLSKAEKALADAMTMQETDGIVFRGRSYKLHPKTKYSKIGGLGDEFFDALRFSGMGDLITETVNAATLNSALNQYVNEEGELPPDLVGMIHTYEMVTIDDRKA